MAGTDTNGVNCAAVRMVRVSRSAPRHGVRCGADCCDPPFDENSGDTPIYLSQQMVTHPHCEAALLVQAGPQTTLDRPT